jgi:hypothetical protein
MRILAVVTALTLAAAGSATDPLPLAAQANADAPASRTPHRTLNKTDCLSCHRAGANEHANAVPDDHARYPNATCIRCHRLADTMPSRSRHPFDAAHARCATCHVAGNRVGAQPTPAATHARFRPGSCIMCHEPLEPAPTPNP